jgi:hypothetical protein
MCEPVKYISPVAPGKNRANINTGSGPEFSKLANYFFPVSPGKNRANIYTGSCPEFSKLANYISPEAPGKIRQKLNKFWSRISPFLPGIFSWLPFQFSYHIFLNPPAQYSAVFQSNIT